MKSLILLLSGAFFILQAHLALGQLSLKSAPDYLIELKSRQDFDLLKGEPLSKTFNGIECIKLVYVIKDKKLYYLESKRYRWHYRFVQEVLGETDDLETFNLKNYGTGSNRKYILGTYNYNINTKNYFLQFSSVDNVSDELIGMLVNEVTRTSYKKDEFKLLLNTTVLLRRKKQLEKYPLLTIDEIFKNQVYQSIFKGKASGLLKFVDVDSIKESMDYSNCILVLNGSSNDIPVCKGVVTSEFQTPLSHICLLTNNRKTPAAAYKNSFDSDSLRKWEGSLVQLTVGEESLSIIPVLKTEKKKKKNKAIRKLKADITNSVVADLNTLSYKDKAAYGSKACNLAELKKIETKTKSISTPPGAFSIPLFYYAEHLKNNGIDTRLQKLLSDSLTMKNDSLLSVELKGIRKTIRQAPLDTHLLKTVLRLCNERFGTAKVRFRSSSNCEDEADFNGAGLYTSETGIPGDTVKSIERAIKKVWAGLWLDRAFKERRYFQIDHSSVYMAVLVHEAYDNELVNGVALTRNIYRNYDFGFVINMQKDENEVVSPKKGMVCEQVISYMNTGMEFFNMKRAADWLSFSSLQPNSSLLTADELYTLTKQLDIIKKHFYNLYKVPGKYKNFGMDVEFKLISIGDQERKFIFKQARPLGKTL